MAGSLEKHPNTNANKKSCPSQSEPSYVEEGEQPHICASTKYVCNEDLKGDKSLGCGTAPKLWPRSPITKIQGFAGTPLSTPPWELLMGVQKSSTTESQGMGWMSTGARVSNLNCMLYNLNHLNWRPGHTHTHTQCPMCWG
jgi:hypothetical protein